MKVLITEKIAETGIKFLEKYMQVDCIYGMNQQEFSNIMDQYDAVIVRGLHFLDKAVIDKAVKLKVIGCNTIGTSVVDVEYAKEKGIGVYNSPDGSVNAVAELAMGLILNLVRNICGAAKSVMNEGKWDKHSFVGSEIKGKVLGLVSLGNIASRVAKLAQAFDMKVIAYDPYVDKAKATEMNVELVELDELFGLADIVSVHAPLTKGTYHMIGAQQFEKMKKGSYLVDVARGGVIDEESLYDALVNGHLTGAALDVLEKEPPNGHKLFSLNNCICTPHIGGSAKEAQETISRTVTEKVVRHLGLI